MPLTVIQIEILNRWLTWRQSDKPQGQVKWHAKWQWQSQSQGSGVSGATPQAPAREGGRAAPLSNYQALGLRNPDTPESWAKVPICNHQITEDDKVLRMFKDVDFITSKIYSDCQVQSWYKAKQLQPPNRPWEERWLRHSYASNDPGMPSLSVVAAGGVGLASLEPSGSWCKGLAWRQELGEGKGMAGKCEEQSCAGHWKRMRERWSSLFREKTNRNQNI